MLESEIKCVNLFIVPAGLHPSSPQHVSHHRLSDNLPEEREKRNEGKASGGPQEQKKNKSTSFVSQLEQQRSFLPAARGLFQGNSSTPKSNLGPAINRQRIFSLEPFHQSSIISSRQKRGREEEREEEGKDDDLTGNPNKKTKLINGRKSHFPSVPLFYHYISKF